MHARTTSWWWAGARGAGVPRPARFTVLATLAAALLPGVAGGQSLLERPANMTGGWVGTPGTLYFNFLHRFTSADPPTRKVSNTPTFLVGAGLPWRLLAGVNYATNSDVAPRFPNEWEAFARWAPLAQDDGRPVDVAVQGGYNDAARSTDAELSLGRRVGRLHLEGAARVLSNAYDLGSARSALAGGAVLRLGRWVGLAGDYATLLDRPRGFEPAWSAAVQLAVPYSPHTLSLQVTNANTATLQGLSSARGSGRRYGFEFTIPLTLGRYLPSRAAPPVASATSSDSVAAPAMRPGVDSAAPARDTTARDTIVRDTTSAAARDTMPLARDSVRSSIPTSPAAPARRAARPAPRIARAGMRQLAFSPSRIEVAAGGTVTWTNRDAMVHTVSDAAGKWDSGPIEPGRSWSRRFDRPGTYAIHCTPHPFMKAVVVVRAADAR